MLSQTFKTQISFFPTSIYRQGAFFKIGKSIRFSLRTASDTDGFGNTRFKKSDGVCVSVCAE